MAPLGVAAADEARFCMTPWSAAAHFENWGDSGIVVTSPLAETASTDVDMVCSSILSFHPSSSACTVYMPAMNSAWSICICRDV